MSELHKFEGFQNFVTVVDQWDSLNEKLTSKKSSQIKFTDERSYRVYSDVTSAVFECAYGTAHFLAHRRSVGVIKGNTNAFDSVLGHFYKQLLNVTVKNGCEIDSISEWVESLKKDTNFVLVCEDHPLTGEKLPFIKELVQILNERRIFVIRLSYFNWKNELESADLLPYEVRLNVCESFVLAICGEKFKSPPMLAHQQKVTSAMSSAILFESHPRLLNEAAIRKFEQLESTFYANYFSSDVSSRLWDRAVVVLKDVNAAAVIELLAEKSNLATTELGLISPQLCLSGGLRQYKGWSVPAFTEEQLRSLLIIPVELLLDDKFLTQLHAAIDEIKSMSFWSV